MAKQREDEAPAGPVVWCYTGSITLTCACGSPIPIVIPFHQGLTPTTRCRTCQGTYQVHGFSVNMKDGSKDQFQIEFKPHMMIEAASQMPDVPVKDVLNNVSPFAPLKR